MIRNRISRIDGLEKATGKAIYGMDVRIPRMLHGKILRSPLAHARVLNIDKTRAEKLPGVKAVITAEDTPKIKYGALVNDEYPLALDRVRYVGDEIAAVAAVDEEIAREAIDLIQVEFEELPAVFLPREALREGAPQIHEQANNLVSRIEFERGDTTKRFAEADFIFEETYQTSNVHPGYLEPHVCVSQLDPGGRVILWGSFQAPSRNRDLIARAINLPIHKIRLIQTTVGGGFGGKATQLLPLYLISVLLTLKTGLPVRMLNTWEEEFATARSRMPSEIRIKLGVKKDGTFTAKELNILANCGAYAGTAPAVLSTTATRASSLYRFPSLKCRADLVYTNLSPVGSYRGYGNPQLHFALESIIDTAAEAIEIDPVAIRLRNAIKVGETSVHGWVMASCQLTECLSTASERTKWTQKRSKRRKENIGIGMASVIHVSGNRSSFPFFDGSTASVRVNRDGKCDLITGEADIGQGSNTIFAQIIAEVLKIRMEDIRVMPLDTDYSPFAVGTYASRLTTVAGKAVQLAAEDARRKLMQTASEMLEARAEDLDISEGKIFVKGSSVRPLRIAEIANDFFQRHGGALLEGSGTYVVPSNVVLPDQDKYGNLSLAYSFGAQVAEVRVDRITGCVEILDFVSVHDSGTILNPLLAEGQVHGGVAQGIGFTLLEDIVRKGGKVLNDNFTDYRMPTMLDIPGISTVFVESSDPFGPFGAKGLGEITSVGAAPAIANAIYDAVGVRLKELPFTPEKILDALKSAASNPVKI